MKEELNSNEIECLLYLTIAFSSVNSHNTLTHLLSFNESFKMRSFSYCYDDLHESCEVGNMCLSAPEDKNEQLMNRRTNIYM